jgi:hypothetical protein
MDKQRIEKRWTNSESGKLCNMDLLVGNELWSKGPMPAVPVQVNLQKAQQTTRGVARSLSVNRKLGDKPREYEPEIVVQLHSRTRGE